MSTLDELLDAIAAAPEGPYAEISGNAAATVAAVATTPAVSESRGLPRRTERYTTRICTGAYATAPGSRSRSGFVAPLNASPSANVITNGAIATITAPAAAV